MIKSYIFKLMMLSVLLTSTLIGCTSDSELDSSDSSYGYIQFKLYKEASYESRAVVSELDYLNDAKRIQIQLLYNGTAITQTVALSAYDELNSEWGMRTEKLLLLSGDYTVTGYTLYDIREQELYYSTMPSFDISVPRGGMELYDLTAKTVERGGARFIFTKDFFDSSDTRSTSGYEDLALLTSSYYAKMTLMHSTLAESYVCDSIPVGVYSVYDSENNNYQSMVVESDSVFILKAGEWKVVNYSFYSSTNYLLATSSPVSEVSFSVADNQYTDAQIPISVDEQSEYIKDYKALYEIWKALDGENWSYYGQSYPTGANWDFNRDVDLWGYQPGVMLHSNGRVASINLSEFGFNGAMPAAIGQLTQLVELYLGTHNDTNADAYAAKMEGLAINGELSSSRMSMAKAYVDSRIGNPLESAISPLMRKAFIERGKTLPGGLTVTQEQIDEQATGAYYSTSVRSSAPQMRADVAQGKYCNGLTSLPSEMGLLESLQYLYIANGKLTELPAELASLEKLTDVEIYNCQDMTSFPMVLAEIPYLVALNVAENYQWSAQEIYNGLDALFSSDNVTYLQLLYCNSTLLEEIPQSMNNATNLSMLMATTCEIKTVHSMPNFAPVLLYLDYNNIEYMPDDFCSTGDLETMSVSNNLLTQMPNFFSKNDSASDSVSFASNKISSISGQSDGSFNGISTLSLDLSGNDFTAYPAVFASSGSWINQMNLSNNMLSEFETDCFVGDNVWYTESIDLNRNYLSSLPDDLNAITLPFLYGVDISYNCFDYVPVNPANSAYLTIYIVRGQRDLAGNRILKTWPSGITSHTGLIGFFIGSNDIREISDTLSYLVYLLDVSDNPNLKLDASAICPYIEAGYYALYYDKTQDIRNCAYLGTY